jgi:hypothetical protein
MVDNEIARLNENEKIGVAGTIEKGKERVGLIFA